MGLTQAGLAAAHPAAAPSAVNLPLAALAEQQSLLLAALFGRGSADELPAQLAHSGLADTLLLKRGLAVYRANAAVLAARALSATFPVLTQLVGVDSFEPLARYFWQQQPPQRGDLAQWGDALAEFVAAAPQLAGEPFLAEVARVEWALHCAATAADAVLDTASFALLTHAEEPVTLTLSAGCALLASAYPAATLVNAHLSGEPTLDEAALLLASGTPEVALVWRHAFKPRVRCAGAGEALLVAALLRRQPLEPALQAACQADAEFDFNAWLVQAVQNGLVTGASLLATPASP